MKVKKFEGSESSKREQLKSSTKVYKIKIAAIIIIMMMIIYCQISTK